MRLILLYIILAIALCSCKNKRKVISKKLDIKFKKEGKLWIMDKKDTLASFFIEIAKSNFERQKGLMNRKSLSPNNAMLFIFEKEENQSFWMKKTYIPLDLIFINKDNKIVNISKDNIPLSLDNISSKVPSQYVLEINGGLSNELNIKTGMSVLWKELEDEK